ncbi:unnamed protein product [Ectocarpus sp. 12 AP-2014]
MDMNTDMDLDGASPVSPLFERITMCANAIRFLKDKMKNKQHKPSYEEVKEFMPQIKVTEHENTNLIRCSLQYLKLGFVDDSTKLRKVNIAMWVAVSIADDHEDDTFLAKAVCERFRRIDDFDRDAMTKIFNFSICNKRVLALLDDAMILREKSIHRKIEHERRAEFVVLFFNVMESLMRRGHTLTDLGYETPIPCTNMERAREIIDLHMDTIATKCWPCFKDEALKKPRRHNILFPAKGALPRVSIGCEHVNFDDATIDTLKGSLLDKEGKAEFLEMIFAAISHAFNDPVVTYRSLKLEWVKTYLLEEMLDEAQKQTLKQVYVSTDVYDLQQRVESLENQLLCEREKFVFAQETAQQEIASLKASGSSMYDKYMTIDKMLRSAEDKVGELQRDAKRLRFAERVLKSKEEHCEMFHVERKRTKDSSFHKSSLPCFPGDQREG